ncbi:MAG: glycogen debranching enzyme GlgX, partial [Hyphomicrobiales bacterium]|nr:glycogen debranching enzyme GlgX [Hyphomicrobiales bacterium]
VLNAHHDMVNFKLPEVAGGTSWIRLIDTNMPKAEEDESFAFGVEYAVTGRSLLLFEVRSKRNYVT